MSTVELHKRKLKQHLQQAVQLELATLPPYITAFASIKRGTNRVSADISMAWAFGVFICMMGMLPSGLTSGDTIFKVFTVGNCLLFGAVVVQILRYR